MKALNLFVLVAGVVGVGLGSQAYGRSAVAHGSSSATAQRESPRVSALKAQILDMAEAFRGDDDADGSLQLRLNGKIKELLKSSPRVPHTEKARRITGAWEQVWGPYSYAGQGPVMFDPDAIYQVIYPDGFYYTIARSSLRGKDITIFLRGEYEVLADKLRVYFTRNMFYVGGWLPAGVSLYDTGLLAENGTLTGPEVPVSRGRGPVDQPPGLLREVYVDDDLRIAYGSREGEDPQYGYLYVLKRVQGVK